MQLIFSAIFYLVSVALFPGFLMVGYATIFTMFPVFSLVLDKDVADNVAMTYPELYKDLAKGRELTFKTFLIWVVISIYQGMLSVDRQRNVYVWEIWHLISFQVVWSCTVRCCSSIRTLSTWYLSHLHQCYSLNSSWLPWPFTLGTLWWFLRNLPV